MGRYHHYTRIANTCAHGNDITKLGGYPRLGRANGPLKDQLS